MTRPIGIDLFAGAGGMSLGFEQAGFDIAAAVEIDPVHCATHHFNFPECTVIPKSVTDVSGDEIREKAGLGDKEIDVVFGGAPCQGFSMIGQRALDDPRNSLVRDFVRIVHELEARYFVFENVKGLTVGKHRKFLEEVIAAFENGGEYQVLLKERVLNAADFGVPQNRHRLFLIGARKDCNLPVYPKQTTHPAGTSNCGSPESPTCAEALGDLPDAEKFKTLWDTDQVATTAWGKPSKYAAELRCQTNDAWHFGHPRDWDPSILTSSLLTAHTEISRRRFKATEGGAVEPISRFFKLAPGGVSNTLRAGTDSARGAFTSPRPIHYKYARCVTVREMARLHGYPDWFRFHETKWHGARQIGNSVPPPLARAVAGEVMKALGIEPTRPTVSQKLGKETLLRMDLSQASKHWEIENPIGRRDRKSGARKRKQEEIEALDALNAGA
ncbi:DNA cytosine methyltransferase [Qipengyuania aurantiaca]|uniref:Cytosine-specific methyltransferase n=1 Tax=Qipengyuania aurantiaca TaxID=2867233 RepID=A0ABX8ZLP4_9SPHN|nr:DNA cytosine methyltransferase [Qipengyuania aurantiaca]QZD89897.1 DNA cytosine methyltransferase [Qipengyuania aurantiaca]